MVASLGLGLGSWDMASPEKKNGVGAQAGIDTVANKIRMR
jgi:hypothetical protein